MIHVAIVAILALYFKGCSKSSGSPSVSKSSEYTAEDNGEKSDASASVNAEIVATVAPAGKSPLDGVPPGPFPPVSYAGTATSTKLGLDLWKEVTSSYTLDGGAQIVNSITPLVQLKADVNHVALNYPINARTPLLYATLEGLPLLVKYLLESKANTELADVDDNTALFTATEDGNVEIVKMLLDHKADVLHLNSGTFLNQPAPVNALSIALSRLRVSQNHRQIASLLIEHKSEVNTYMAILLTSPLFYVCKFDSTLDLLKLMVEAGEADLTSPGGRGPSHAPNIAYGYTPLQFALKNGATQIVDYLRSVST